MVYLSMAIQINNASCMNYSVTMLIESEVCDHFEMLDALTQTAVLRLRNWQYLLNRADLLCFLFI